MLSAPSPGGGTQPRREGGRTFPFLWGCPDVRRGFVMRRAAQVSAPVQAFMTPRETAELLRRSVKSLYRLIEADASFPRLRLPSESRRDGRASGGLLIPRAALERWLADHSEGMRNPVRLAMVTQ